MEYTIISGRITSDIKKHDYSNANKNGTYVKFSVAVSKGKNKDGSYRPSKFFSCISFDSQGDFIEKWFKKGSGINVQGDVDSYHYQGKDGETKSGLNLNVRQVFFPPKDSDSSNSAYSDDPFQSHNLFNQTESDEIPF